MTRIIFYNLEYLEGIEGKTLTYLEIWKRFIGNDKIRERIAKKLKKYNPDILSFVEVRGKPVIGHDDDIQYFKKELAMPYSVRKVKYDLRGKIDIIKLIPFLNHQSNAILSKHKINQKTVIYFHEGIKRAVIRTKIIFGKELSVILVHLALGEKTREKQIKELEKIVKRNKGPVILTGDFNAYQGPSEIEELIKSSGLNYHKIKSKTFPTYKPKERIDYILTSDNIKVKNFKILPIKESDHLPILLDFDIK